MSPSVIFGLANIIASAASRRVTVDRHTAASFERHLHNKASSSLTGSPASAMVENEKI